MAAHYTSDWLLNGRYEWTPTQQTPAQTGQRFRIPRWGVWRCLSPVSANDNNADTWQGIYWENISNQYQTAFAITPPTENPTVGLVRPFAHSWDPGRIYQPGDLVRDVAGGVASFPVGPVARFWRSLVDNNLSVAQWNNVHINVTQGVDSTGSPYGYPHWILDDSLGTGWADVVGRIILDVGSSGAVRAFDGECCARFTTDAGPHHASEITVARYGTDAGPTVRQSATADTSYWATCSDEGTYSLWAVVDGVKRLVASAATGVFDSVLRLEVVGDRLTLKSAEYSGAPYTTRIIATDNAIPSGFMGLRAVGTAPVPGVQDASGSFMSGWSGDQLDSGLIARADPITNGTVRLYGWRPVGATITVT